MAREIVTIECFDVHKRKVRFEFEPNGSNLEPIKQFIHEMARGVWHQDIRGEFYSPVHIVRVIGYVE